MSFNTKHFQNFSVPFHRVIFDHSISCVLLLEKPNESCKNSNTFERKTLSTKKSIKLFRNIYLFSKLNQLFSKLTKENFHPSSGYFGRSSKNIYNLTKIMLHITTDTDITYQTVNIFSSEKCFIYCLYNSGIKLDKIYSIHVEQ